MNEDIDLLLKNLEDNLLTQADLIKGLLTDFADLTQLLHVSAGISQADELESQQEDRGRDV